MHHFEDLSKSEASTVLPERRQETVLPLGAEKFARVRVSQRSAVFILVVLAIVAGSVLRFAHLKDIPPALNQDEVVNGYDAYSLLSTGRDHHGHPFPFAGLESFGDWASPLLAFLTIPAVALFGLRVEALRAVTAGMGVLAIPIIYWLALEL